MSDLATTKTMMAILSVLKKNTGEVMGSRELSRQLKSFGIELTERTIRYHLKIMDERGLTKVYGKEGRKITERGIEELSNSMVSERIGFIISKIESLSYQTDFDIEKKRGKVILNFSCIRKENFKAAMKIAAPVFKSPYIMSDYVYIASEGDRIGEMLVPEGMIGMGTVCSVTINGVLLKQGIPMTSKYGGLVEVSPEGPTRFTALISYEGSSLDPLLIFIKSRMTNVTSAVNNGAGKVLASFREIPLVCIDSALEYQEKLRDAGIGGLLMIGGPNQPLLEVPVGVDRAGVIVVGGLNPLAAIEEAGIPTENIAMSVLKDYSDLTPFDVAVKNL